MATELRVNEGITSPTVRVIGAEGDQLGIMTRQKALAAADEAGLDLVEVAPQAEPPVCRLMDYGKHKFKTKKTAQKGGKVNRAGQVKEVKFRPRTDDHDLSYKIKNLLKFLAHGQKVKVSLFFRGRERTHVDRYSAEFIPKVMEMIGEAGIVEQPPRLEGNALSMVIAPKPQK